MRSRAAAAMFGTSGFGEVYSMEGGINAWQGLIAAGTPDAGMSFFPADAEVSRLITLAWVLEEGSRRFYAAVAEMSANGETGKLFADLAVAEEHHKEALLRLYRTVAKREPGSGFPQDIVQADQDRMEGGVSIGKALQWAKGRNGRDLLELSLSLETDSYDLYIKMGRRVTGAAEQEVFHRLAEEEKGHLHRMAALLDQML
jgi:rubrerythrin